MSTRHAPAADQGPELTQEGAESRRGCGRVAPRSMGALAAVTPLPWPNCAASAAPTGGFRGTLPPIRQNGTVAGHASGAAACPGHKSSAAETQPLPRPLPTTSPGRMQPGPSERLGLALKQYLVREGIKRGHRYTLSMARPDTFRLARSCGAVVSELTRRCDLQLVVHQVFVEPLVPLSWGTCWTHG